MSALDDIGAAAKALNDLSAAEAAEKARIDAAVAAALAAVVAGTRPVYIDSAAGLDANDGTTPQRAVASWGAALALLSAGQAGAFFLLNDLVIGSLQYVFNRVDIFSYGVDFTKPSAGGTVRTVTIAPPAQTTTPTGSYAVVTQRSLGFWAVNVKLGALATSSGAAGAFAVQGLIQFTNLAISWDPAFAVPLFIPAAFMEAIFVGVTLPSAYAGKLFAGVTAGANPNNSPLIRTTLNAA